MAENYQINIDVKSEGTEDVQGKFDSLRDEIANTEKAIDKLMKTEGKSIQERKHNNKKADELRKKLGQLNVEYDELDKTQTDYNATLKDTTGDMGSLQQQINSTTRVLEAMALAGETNTDDYKNLTKRVNELKNAQKEVNKELKDGATTSDNFKSAAHGIAGALEVSAVAMSAFGMESESVEEKILAVQQAMALAEGIKNIQHGATAFVAMGKSAKTALSGIRVGLIATGIGAFVVALGAVVAYWDDIVAAVGDAEHELDGLNDTTNEVNKKFIDLNAEVADMKNSFDMAREGTISHEQALEQYNKEFGDTIGFAKDFETAENNFLSRTDLYIKATKARALADAFYKKNAEKMVEAQEALTTKQMSTGHTVVTESLNILSKGTEAISFGLFKSETSSAADMEKIYKKRASRLLTEEAEAFEVLGNQFSAEAFKLQGQLDAIVGDQNKKSKDKTKARVKELIDISNDIIDIEFTNLEKIYGETLDSAIIRLDQKMTKDLEKYDKLLEDKRISTEQHEEVVKELETRYDQDRNLLRQEFALGRMEIRDQEVEAELVGAEKTVSIYGTMYKALHDMSMENAKKREELETRNKEFAINSAITTFDAIANFAQAFEGESEKSAKRSFNIMKAANIATAIATTYMSATQAYASQFLPVPDPSSPVRGGIAAGVAVASGLANVAMIAKQKFRGSSTGGGGGGATPSGNISAGGQNMQGSFNVVGNSGINQLADLSMQPTQAYVVSGDITTAQSLDRNKIENATF